MSTNNVPNNTPTEQLQSEAGDIIPAETKSLTVADPKSLDLAEQALVAKIIEAPDRDELQKQFDLFNINQSKKNALRIVKLNSLLDKVEDQAIERFQKRPDQVSNKELLEYMNVISGQIDRAQKHVDSISVMPAIAVTAQKTDVTINVGSDLDRDSKERVMDAISALLKQVKNAATTSESTPTNFIEADFEDNTESSDTDLIEGISFDVSEDAENKE